jgi:hypothetical protein
MKPIINNILGVLNEFVIGCLRIVLLKLLYDTALKNRNSLGLVEAEYQMDEDA